MSFDFTSLQQHGEAIHEQPACAEEVAPDFQSSVMVLQQCKRQQHPLTTAWETPSKKKKRTIEAASSVARAPGKVPRIPDSALEHYNIQSKIARNKSNHYSTVRNTQRRGRNEECQTNRIHVRRYLKQMTCIETKHVKRTSNKSRVCTMFNGIYIYIERESERERERERDRTTMYLFIYIKREKRERERRDIR